MAYERTVWVNGITPINAENLNNIEEGIDSVMFDIGSIASANIAAGAYREINISFNKEFEKTPVVFFNLYSTSNDGNVGKCVAAYVPNSGTKNGCKVRIYNGDSSTRAPALEWKAMNKDLFV